MTASRLTDPQGQITRAFIDIAAAVLVLKAGIGLFP